MTNEEYEKKRQRYNELAPKFFSNAKMSPEEILEFFELDEIFGQVEEQKKSL